VRLRGLRVTRLLRGEKLESIFEEKRWFSKWKKKAGCQWHRAVNQVYVPRVNTCDLAGAFTQS